MKREFDAWHLPGVNTAGLGTHQYELGRVVARVPVVRAEHIAQVLEHMMQARAALRALPATQIATQLADAAQRLNNKETHELVTAVTGYSKENVADILAHMMADWSEAALHALLRAELGDPAVLDAQPAATTRAIGPALAFHIFSGNVPGVAVTSIMRSLLVKAPTFGKAASGEPVLPVLFARALAETAPAIADCLAVTYWPGGTAELEAVALQHADLAVVYGGAETVRDVAARVPAETRLVVHGPKLSLGAVAARPPAGTAAAVARAAAAYDQQGCVSPHVVYVEADGSGSTRDFARDVANELAILAETLPRGEIGTGEALAIRGARTRAEFREGCEVFGPEDLAFTVIHDSDPTLAPSCLNRTLYIKPLAGLEALPGLLMPHRALLQSVALAGFADDEVAAIAPLLADAGVTRITTFERLPWPPMTWHHDGRGPLRELLAWQDFEG